MILKVEKINDNAIAPTRGSEDAAGYDFYIHRFDEYSQGLTFYRLFPNETLKVHLGVKVEIYRERGESGTYALILKERSGLALRGLHVHGGVIDQDYRGELSAILYNGSNAPIDLEVSQKIVQGIIIKVFTPTVSVPENGLSTTKRGDKGFGSTGV